MAASDVRRPVALIVEDELLLRLDAAEMAKAAGFDVVEAGNADEAIAMLDGRPLLLGHSDARIDARRLPQKQVAAD